MVHQSSVNSQSLLKTTSQTILLPFLFMAFLASSCGNDSDELDKKINIAIRSGNDVNEDEWNELIKYINDNEDHFLHWIEDDEVVNSKMLADYILTFSKERARPGQPEPDIFNPNTTAENSTNAHVKFFIENSGSMDGYVRGKKDFEIVVGRVLVLCKDYCSQDPNSNFDIFFINKTTFPAPEIKELTEFARVLEPNNNSPFTQGDRNESILNDILKIIIDSVNENSISILVSDCIYSLAPTKDTKGALGYQQNGTMDVFLNKFRNNSDLNITTCIYKMESNYEGYYFPYDYDPKLGNSINLFTSQPKRPYYIWVIGESRRVSELNSKINFEKLDGFQHSYVLSNFTKQTQPYYSVLKETNKVGFFKPANRTEKAVKDLSDVKFDNNLFQFSIAIDLSGIPVDSSYLMDVSNYPVPDGFTVVSIDKVDRNKLSPNEMVTLQKTTATHFITVSTTSKFSIQDLRLELSNKIPDWVELSSSADDRKIEDQLDRTFGLEYLVQGVSDAYATQNPGQTSYFSIIVTIKM